MKRRFIHITLMLGLVAGLFAGAVTTSSAQFTPPDVEIEGTFGQYGAFLPWVPNGVPLDDAGPYYGAVTVQNIEHLPIEVDVYVGLGARFDEELGPLDWAQVETLSLAPHESITISANSLQIPEEVGLPVALVGRFLETPMDNPIGDALAEVFEAEGIDWPARIAAQVKNVSPIPGNSASTTSTHLTVDGYSALTLDQIWSDEGTFILPIVQNNSGWDTTIRVAHFGEFDDFGDSLTNVTVTFYGSGEQGFAGFSEVVNLQIRPGGVATIELSEHVPDDFVGSAFITSNAAIGAVAERYKSETDMLVTNVSRPEVLDDSTQYAPLVFKEYNFWNTGIAIANTDPTSHNSVTVTYYGPTMNQVGQDTLTIPPRGMEFIYTPGSQDLGLSAGFVGSARISGTTTFHAAVDQVKYFGDDPDVGQAMSYIVEHLPGQFYDFSDFPIDLPPEFGFGDTLALPLAQKGNPQTGTGDTSGIQLFNTSLSNSIHLATTFYGANGLPVAPTVDNNDPTPMLITLAPSQSYTLYTHGLSEMSAGFQGSATVEVVGGGGGVAGVSNNVNYDVQADGSTAYNMPTVAPIYQVLDFIFDFLCEFLELFCDVEPEAP